MKLCSKFEGTMAEKESSDSSKDGKENNHEEYIWKDPEEME